MSKMFRPPSTTGNTSTLPDYTTVHMSVCICKVIKVAVQSRNVVIQMKTHSEHSKLIWTLFKFKTRVSAFSGQVRQMFYGQAI